MGRMGIKRLKNGVFGGFQGAKYTKKYRFRGADFMRKCLNTGVYGRLHEILAYISFYSKRMMPITRATAYISEYSNSNGSYCSLSDTIRMCCLSCPGLMRLMSAP